MSVRGVALSLVISTSVLGVSVPSAVLAQPVEYVRVCDAFGSGYFYIPGTETCLNIRPRLGFSVIQNPSNLGVGTVVYNLGATSSEMFAAGQNDWLGRINGGFSWQYEIGEYEAFSHFGVTPIVFVYFDGDIAGGSSDEYGQAQVGGNVTAVAFTFAQRDPVRGTGVIATAPGFGMTARTETDHFWAAGTAGLGKTYPLDLDEGYGGIVVKTGPYFETLNYDSYGRADLLFNGAPFNNYYQGYSYDSRDTWVGLRSDIAVHWHPSHNWFFSFGVFATAAYHRGEANFWQTTVIGTAPPPNNMVVQWLNFADTDFSIGGGAEFSANYAFNENIQLGLNLSASVLSDVTALNLPQNPNQQPAFYSQEDIARFFANLTLNIAFPVE